MDPAHKKKRKEARKLYLTGECLTNAEIARKLGLKPHTVSKYRKEEDWDGLRVKIDRRAAEKMVEHLANERVSLNLRHYNYYEIILAEIRETLKASHGKFTSRDLAELVGIVEKAQRGQRLAKGLSATGETEEAIRAQAEADSRAMVDAFVDSVKEHIPDDLIREKIGLAVMAKFPTEPDTEDDAAA